MDFPWRGFSKYTGRMAPTNGLATRSARLFVLAGLAVLAGGCAAGPRGGGDDHVIFHDTFGSTLGSGWRWVREDPASWRVGRGGLEVRIQPGNMWGPANDARNVLVRDAPDP